MAEGVKPTVPVGAGQIRSSSRVAIVGGGYAGFAAAVELASRGIRVQLFEAGPMFGGRARRVPYRDLELDNGAHILLGAYSETLRLMGTVGAEESALLRLPLQLTIKDRLTINAAPLPAPWHLLAGILVAEGLSWPERIGALRFMTALRRVKFHLPADTTVAELLTTHRQQGRLARYLWQPLCVSALNTPPAEASAQVFLNVLRDSFARKRTDSDLLLPRLDLSRLFPDMAAAYLAHHGGQASLLSPVTRIEAAGGGFTLVARDEVVVADAVVIATGPQQVTRLLSSMPGTADTTSLVDNLAHKPICTVYVQYPAHVGLPAPMLGLSGGMVQWLFDRESLHGQRGLIAAVISAAGAHGATNNEATAIAVVEEIAQHFPRFGTPVWTKVVLEKFATIACTPGLTRPTQKTGVRGLFLAGDYTEDDYPATLEAAVRSGIKCAELIASEVS